MNTLKIVYCLDEIEAVGGIERVTIAKANALSRIPGNEVYLAVAYARKAPSLPVDPAVKIVDLDVRYYDDKDLSRTGRMVFLFKKRKEHRRKMEKLFNELAPDIAISTGMSEKHFLSRLSVSPRPAYIREFHFYKFHRKVLNKSLFEKLAARISEFKDFNFSVKRYDKIVILTEEDKEKNWTGWKNIEVIPNPVVAQADRIASLDNNVVVTAGRLVEQKNYESLISAWKIVSDKHPDWELRIFGDGSMREELQKQIEDSNLSDKVKLCGFTKDIPKEMGEASMYVLSSLYEGFPLVLVEAMSCGLPVVSYMCPCGPNDIIRDGKDGFLVAMNDEKQLADRIMTLMEDKDLRKRMGAAAKEKASYYRPDVIIERWMNLFKSIR